MIQLMGMAILLPSMQVGNNVRSTSNKCEPSDRDLSPSKNLSQHFLSDRSDSTIGILSIEPFVLVPHACDVVPHPHSASRRLVHQATWCNSVSDDESTLYRN